MIKQIPNFPIKLIRPTDKVLCLFCAAFGGSQDVIHVKRAGVKSCVLVDNDEEKLKAMKFDYEKVCKDAFMYIQEAKKNKLKFDVIIADPFSNLMPYVMDLIPDFKQIATRHVIIACNKKYLDSNKTKDNIYWRSDYKGGIYWRVVNV